MRTRRAAVDHPGRTGTAHQPDRVRLCAGRVTARVGPLGRRDRRKTFERWSEYLQVLGIHADATHVFMLYYL